MSNQFISEFKPSLSLLPIGFPPTKMYKLSPLTGPEGFRAQPPEVFLADKIGTRNNTNHFPPVPVLKTDISGCWHFRKKEPFCHRDNWSYNLSFCLHYLIVPGSYRYCCLNRTVWISLTDICLFAQFGRCPSVRRKLLYCSWAATAWPEASCITAPS